MGYEAEDAIKEEAVTHTLEVHEFNEFDLAATVRERPLATLFVDSVPRVDDILFYEVDYENYEEGGPSDGEVIEIKAVVDRVERAYKCVMLPPPRHFAHTEVVRVYVSGEVAYHSGKVVDGDDE